MLSKLLTASNVFRRFQTGIISDSKSKSNLINKRWSGHNAMDIEPSNHEWYLTKNWFHFYIVLTAVPLAIISTIINIRANPELTEIPEGYEPRHWEYYRHPITRFLAKHFYYPPEYEYELQAAHFEYINERRMYGHIAQRVEQVMKFYNDHRSIGWHPGFAEYERAGRDQLNTVSGFINSSPNEGYDAAYDPDVNPVPTEGYTRRNESSE